MSKKVSRKEKVADAPIPEVIESRFKLPMFMLAIGVAFFTVGLLILVFGIITAFNTGLSRSDRLTSIPLILIGLLFAGTGATLAHLYVHAESKVTKLATDIVELKTNGQLATAIINRAEGITIGDPNLRDATVRFKLRIWYTFTDSKDVQREAKGLLELPQVFADVQQLIGTEATVFYNDACSYITNIKALDPCPVTIEIDIVPR